MKALFDSLTLEQVRDHTSEVIADILERVRRHQVDIKGIISTVVVTTLVLEGWSTKLNPDIRILETLKVTPGTAVPKVYELIYLLSCEGSDIFCYEANSVA